MLGHRFASLPSWSNPFRELDQARREVERLFDSLADFGGLRTAGVFPAINVTETEEAVIVRAELPGIQKEDIDVTVEDNSLTIAGERTRAAEHDSASFHRREREWGSFRRTFTLPTQVAASRVEARYSDGILTVELPKADEAKPKQITVRAGA